MRNFSLAMSRLWEKISGNPIDFFRVITPILLTISFIVVLIGWFEYKDYAQLAIPIQQKLSVPLMVFGVLSILAILLFAKSDLSMFLAIAVVAYVVGGDVLSKQISESITGNHSPYTESSAQLGTPNYSGGAIIIPDASGASSLPGTLPKEQKYTRGDPSPAQTTKNHADNKN